MPNSALELQAVSVSYRGRQVLQDIGLRLEAGEALALVGLNGAGKTTLLKALLDFIAIDSGSIQLFGVSHRQPESRAALAFLPEQFSPPPYLSGWDFLSSMAKLHGRRASRAELESLCARLDFDPTLLPRPASEYSKGTAQKLGLAGCLAGDKPLLILDEPASGLDPKAQAYLKQELKQQLAQGHTLFFSTHSLADAASLASRLAVLHEGKLGFTGTPREFCERYGADTLEQAYLAFLRV
jgi:ABC-2 type transport system ATP-binding protein